MNSYENLEIELNVMHHNILPSNVPQNAYMNCLYINAQSLRNSLNDLQSFINELNFRIELVLVVETWLNESDKKYYNLINYQSFHSVREVGNGGGASIFIHNDYDIGNIIFEESVNNNNFLLLSLLKQHINIGLAYRQPNNKLDPNGKLFMNKLELLLSTHNKSYFFGDFNFNLFADTPQITEYKNLIYSNGFKFLNSFSNQFPTRINNRFESSTSIDHIFTDLHFFKDTLKHNFYLFDGIGDHKNIILNINQEQSHENTKTPSSFSFINNNKIHNLKLLENVNANTFDNFLNDIKSIIKENTVSFVRKSKSKKPYVNKHILKLIKIRNRYMTLKVKYPHSEYLLERFRFYKSLVFKAVKTSKKTYYEKIFKENTTNPRITWQHINNLLYNKTNTKKPECSQLKRNGISTTEPEIIANHLNDFFINVPNTITNNLNINMEYMEQAHQEEHYDIKFGFTCPEVTEDEIKLIINNLTSSNACDIYGISNNFIKFHKNSLITSLTTLININIFSGHFPDCLKIGIVTPIHKNGDKTSTNNYRPITISPVIGKIFEYAILRRLEDHVFTNNIIHSNQFGYVKRSNTEVAISHILNPIYTHLDTRNAVSLTCIDLSKAFDCINHDILILKLKKLELAPFFLKLLISYLSNRKQATKIGNTLSAFLTIIFGTPQGGVLSGLFFNIYVNSIFHLPLSGEIFLYCDDMSIVNHATNSETLKEMIENDLKLIRDWLDIHILVPNISKTKYLLFHNKMRFESFTEHALNIKFCNILIERVEHIKILGIDIDETLSFKWHLQTIHNRIISFAYALKRIRYLLSDKTLLCLYYAHIQSHLHYMNFIWTPITQYLMNSIEVAQRKALKIILKKSWCCSRNELYNIKILPVSVLCDVNSCLQVFKVSKRLTKCNIEVVTANQIHQFHTRYREDFVIKSCNTVLSSQNFFIRGFNLYNSLPQEIKRFNSLSIVKNRIREHFFQKYCDANNIN